MDLKTVSRGFTAICGTAMSRIDDTLELCLTQCLYTFLIHFQQLLNGVIVIVIIIITIFKL